MSMVARLQCLEFIIQDEFRMLATGSSVLKTAAVAVTTGLLERLNREDWKVLLLMNLGHIRNYDVRLQTIAIALGAVIALLVQLVSNDVLVAEEEVG